jgi:hypothetical protein
MKNISKELTRLLNQPRFCLREGSITLRSVRLTTMFYASKALLSLKRIYPKTHRGVVSELGLKFVNDGYIEELYGKIEEILRKGD